MGISSPLSDTEQASDSSEEQKTIEASWKKWGPYLTERQWGTVREDYSADGQAWGFISHDMARSKAYRWGEEGIAGISDDQQVLCFALALWNKKDPILKERYFGLTGDEGNHGEDVKEYYYYLDNTPSHDYMKMLYKYPQREFPYKQLVEGNRRRSKRDMEFELIDTGIFNDDHYFDVFIEYAKNDPEDILIRISVHNRGQQDASINVLPTIWFRNTWSWGYDSYKPTLSTLGQTCIMAEHTAFGNYFFDCSDNPEFPFTENETNTKRLNGVDGSGKYFKDGINNFIVQGDTDAICNDHRGTKACANNDIGIKAGQSYSIRRRLQAGRTHLHLIISIQFSRHP